MKKSGQITVFLSMVLLCIAALLGALMESARTAGPGAICGLPPTPPWIL